MTDNAGPTPWSEHLIALSNALATAHKSLRKASADPFDVVQRIYAVRHALTTVGVDADKSLDTILPALESECVRLEAEFWGLLTEACAGRGWEVLGSTNRRLVNRAVFVSHEGSTVKVEGLAAGCTPYIPTLMPTLTGIVEELTASEAELRSFLGVLAKVYDTVPRPGSEMQPRSVVPALHRRITKAEFLAQSKRDFVHSLKSAGISLSNIRNAPPGCIDDRWPCGDSWHDDFVERSLGDLFAWRAEGCNRRSAKPDSGWRKRCRLIRSRRRKHVES